MSDKTKYTLLLLPLVLVLLGVVICLGNVKKLGWTEGQGRVAEYNATSEGYQAVYRLDDKLFYSDSIFKSNDNIGDSVNLYVYDDVAVERGVLFNRFQLGCLIFFVGSVLFLPFFIFNKAR